MQIFTSFYDNVSRIDASGYALVRVSRTAPPDWFCKAYPNHVDLSEHLGPSPAMLKECHPLHNWEEFRPRYIDEVLGALEKEWLKAKFKQIFSDNEEHPLLLLCYETAEENCHRHLIGDYLGLHISELQLSKRT